MQQKKIKTPLNDVLLVGFDFTHEVNQSILIVGKKNGKTTDIINAFQGEDARALYDLLVTQQKK